MLNLWEFFWNIADWVLSPPPPANPYLSFTSLVFQNAMGATGVFQDGPLIQMPMPQSMFYGLSTTDQMFATPGATNRMFGKLSIINRMAISGLTVAQG